MRPKIHVRMAKNEDGPEVEDLVLRGGGFGNFEDWRINWSDIEPYWLLAEERGDPTPLGVIQFLAGKPIARLEMLSIDPNLPLRTRAMVAKELVHAGQLMARLHGSECLSGHIPHEMKGYQKVAERRGWVPLADGLMNYKRIA